MSKGSVGHGIFLVVLLLNVPLAVIVMFWPATVWYLYVPVFAVLGLATGMLVAEARETRRQ